MERAIACLTPPVDSLYGRSRRNLAGWFTLSMGSILIVFAAVIYGLGVRDRLLSFDAELESKARVMAAGIRYGLHRGEWRIKLDDVPVLGSNTLPLDQGIAYARWYDAEGNLVRFVQQAPPQYQVQALGFVTLPAADEGGARLRQITLPVRQDDLVIGYLEIAAPLTNLQEQLTRQLVWLSVGVPLALGTIGLTGWWLGGVAMTPLRQSHQRLQQFTNQASHELRTPLAQVLGHAQLLLQTETDERWRLERIATITKTMGQLVGDLLFLARHTGQLNSAQLQPLDLRELVQELAWDGKAIAADRQLTLTCDLPPAPVWVAANIDLLHQALLNLIDNALKYTPPGGSIQLTVTGRQGWATAQVINTGANLPPAAISHVFERFYRQPASEAVEGFGLGLAIAQQIAQAHGGDIVATSSGGDGKTNGCVNHTCFALRLPLGRP